MQNSSVSSCEFDEALSRILKKVSLSIDCTECASCCRELQPLFSEPDINRFAQGLGIGSDEFRDNHLVYNEEREGWCFPEKPCPFLKNNRCSNYEHRPEDCRSYPHLDSPDQIYRLWKTIYQFSVCPIVRRVCEQLKEIYW